MESGDLVPADRARAVDELLAGDTGRRRGQLVVLH